MTELVINIEEKFEHLPRAPIAEAVIDIRARAAAVLEEGALKPLLEAKLAGYQFLDSQREIEIQHEVRAVGDAPPSSVIRDLGWKGLLFRSADERHIVQFNRNGFVFSRLDPYDTWQRLHDEGMRLWKEYVVIAQPIEIHRIGLRYINRIQLPPNELRFEDYLEPAPVPPRALDLPFHGFMHQDTLGVPGYPYAMNIIRTIQPPAVQGGAGFGLILDIDVFTTQGFELDEATLERRLLEMRWLKNKVFFGSVTPKARTLFQ